MREFVFGLLTVVLISILLVGAQAITDSLPRDTAFIVAFIFGSITSTIVDFIGHKVVDGK